MKGKHILPAALALGFILGCSNGYVALWRQGQSSPLRVYPCRVSTLPPADQYALGRGIIASNEEELAHLLEDYLS